MMQIKFSPNFLWGTATAAYQIEGAVLEDGRGESVWDHFSHIPGKILNGDTGDIACDHYHRYKQDIALMKELALQAYRFSIAWPRIFPEGKGKINQAGIDFYDQLIDELLNAGIEPVVTLNHWDMPQVIQNQGGWANQITIDYFAEYAKLMFSTFGDRVPKWITHNEPQVEAFCGHAYGTHAPGLQDPALGVQVAHHLLLAHAKTVQTYRQSNRKGMIGITLNLTPAYPASASPQDKAAAILADSEKNRWFLDPVLKGNYPADMLKIYQKKLKTPLIESGEMELIAGQRSDFIGVNYYSRCVIKHSEPGSPDLYQYVNPQNAPYTEMNWEIFPEGLYDLLIRLKHDYNDPHILITENGAAFKDYQVVEGVVMDDDRLDYLKGHLTAMQRAIGAGVKLDGYFLWSLLDNFEWAHGYSKKFGIVKVDYHTQARSIKKSGYWYRDVIRNHGFEG